MQLKECQLYIYHHRYTGNVPEEALKVAHQTPGFAGTDFEGHCSTDGKLEIRVRQADEGTELSSGLGRTAIVLEADSKHVSKMKASLRTREGTRWFKYDRDKL